MRAFVEILRSGLDGIVLHPLRSAVTVLAVLAPLVPFLVGLAVSQGIAREAESSLASGGDLYVTGSQFGRLAPLPALRTREIAALDGVASVTPRIIGPITLGSEGQDAVLVGVPAEGMPVSASWVRGRLPRPAAVDELAIGSELARRLRLNVGDTLPPFYRSRSGDRLSRVVGILRPEGPIWSARVVLTPIDVAERIFDEPGMVTDIQVRCRSGAEGPVAAAIMALDGSREPGAPGLRVTSRSQYRSLLEQSTQHREGLFQLHLLVALASGIGVLLVTSGVGMTARTREIGLLKATGWGTDEVLLRSLSESLCLSALASSIAVLLTIVWLRFFNAWGIGGLLISGLEWSSPVRIPYALSPFSVGAAALAAFGVVLTGSLFGAWRAAVTPPLAALKA